jgi:hypothetical protein
MDGDLVTTSGVVGDTLGLLAGIGALAIPGVGPLIAAGAIMATLASVPSSEARNESDEFECSPRFTVLPTHSRHSRLNSNRHLVDKINTL